MKAFLAIAVICFSGRRTFRLHIILMQGSTTISKAKIGNSPGSKGSYEANTETTQGQDTGNPWDTTHQLMTVRSYDRPPKLLRSCSKVMTAAAPLWSFTFTTNHGGAAVSPASPPITLSACFPCFLEQQSFSVL